MLSDADISRIASTPCAVPGSYVHTFARAIESDVRAQDTALIRQLVEALEGYRRNHNDGQPCDAEKAGRARLLDSDLSKLTERGAKAWAGVDAQKLREGGSQ